MSGQGGMYLDDRHPVVPVSEPPSEPATPPRRSPDPRIEAMRATKSFQYGAAFGIPADAIKSNVEAVLAAADAADREAGVIRVDTTDEATAERIVDAIVDHNTLSGSDLDGTARAVLAALREDGAA